jgi:hypothetical protein
MFQVSRFEVAATPVLVLVLLDTSQLATAEPTEDDRAAKEGTDQFVRDAVSGVCKHMVKLTHQPGCRQRPRAWFVQPVDALAPPRALRCGYYAGVNWLLRAMGQEAVV